MEGKQQKIGISMVFLKSYPCKCKVWAIPIELPSNVTCSTTQISVLAFDFF
jgi:hypothetical protein